MMITPITICWMGAGTLSITSPLNSTPMIRAPTMVLVILPRPPNSDAPPTTAAAMACSSNPWPEIACAAMRRDVKISAATPTQKPLSTYTLNFMRGTSMPAARAASGFPPTT